MSTKPMRAAVLAAAVLSLSSSSAPAAVPTLRTITIDGNLSDWAQVLVNSLNVTLDGDGSVVPCNFSTDRDCKVQSTGRDLRRFAWTHDSTHVYLFAQRQGSDSNTQVFWFFMDLNQDQLMGAGDRGLRVRFHGSSGDTDSDLYPYVPANPGGDPLVDGGGFADGYTLPGFLSSPPIWSEDEPDGGSASGEIFEARVPWSALGVPAGTPIYFHVASSNSPNPGNVSTQVDDNLGQLGGGGGSFGFTDVTVTPDGAATTAGGGTTVFPHVLTNSGTLAASFQLKTETTLGLAVTIFEDANGDGQPEGVIAVDANGDGDYLDVGDSTTPGWDRNGDTLPDTPELAPSETFAFVVSVETRVGMSNVVETTSVTAFLAESPRDVTSVARDVTSIGDVVLLSSQSKGTVGGEDLAYALRACNNGAADVFDFTVTSTLGYPAQLHSDPDCDGSPDVLLARDAQGDANWDQVLGGDTDGDGRPDTGSISAGQCVCYVLTISVPGGLPEGTSDLTTVSLRGNTGPTLATAELTTTVGARIDFSPDHTVAADTEGVSSAGKSVFFPHVVTNNGAAPDAADFTVTPPTSTQGWVVQVWSDPNRNGNIADGELISRTPDIAPNGGTVSVVVEVQVPVDAQPGDSDTVVVTATSVGDPGSEDSVTDEVRISRLSSYSNDLYTDQASYFGPCATIYVEGSGLEHQRGGGSVEDIYDLIYVDAQGNPARIHDLFISDREGRALDEYTLNGADVVGAWRLELREGTLLNTVETITVEANGTLTLTTDQPAYPLTGASLGISTSVRNDNVQAWLEGTILEYVILDPTGTMYLVSGAPSTFQPYTGSETTRSVPVIDLMPGATVDDIFTVPNVTFSSEGVHEVIVRWLTPCGVLREDSFPFVVGSGEVCDNGLDDDGDGLVDCADPECALAPNCVESDCDNGLDDDGDGLVDCADPDCPACLEDCDNDLDDDGDGLIDCADPNCALTPTCVETECADGLDNDDDGDVDCDDSDCTGNPFCRPESECDNDVDDDGDTLIDCADPDCDLNPACHETQCSDGLDNDGDGFTDCADSECAPLPECQDSDGDTVLDPQDCAPQDGTAFAVPPEVPLLLVEKGPGPNDARLAWTDVAPQAGTGTVYDVIRGVLSELWEDRDFRRAECLANDLAATSRLDPALVAIESDGRWYLVRAENACGEGSLGTDSYGALRTVPANICP